MFCCKLGNQTSAQRMDAASIQQQKASLTAQPYRLAEAGYGTATGHHPYLHWQGAEASSQGPQRTH